MSALRIDFAGSRLVKLTIKSCITGGFDVDYKVQNVPFERIRRITGYLTGDVKTWNNAKKIEEQERVKHDYESDDCDE